ncbi:uncharacterized protein LOC119676269 [Teleopsis dalmanni]|uniref:uncharacterized protein LOC119676269 n=1 Tax=Teleopsis dalmanni TaxID=139649 RepID=UPI0018CF1310|nr:uncharacterized protein LOC119676269 [Teleopsis dalmanni]
MEDIAQHLNRIRNLRVFHLRLVCAIFNSDAIPPAKNNNLEQFNYCLRQAKHPSLTECVGRTAINFLQRFDEKENVTILNDVVSAKDDKIAARSLVNILDTDPVDFRGILENAGAVLGQRSLEWHMDGLYPGLMFKIGPTADANSLAEFVLDTAVDERQFGYEEPSTARLLTKQYLLPFLLGLKFNVIALVPLLFAVICLLLKKSLFFAKLAIYVSSFLGVGGALGALGNFGGFSGFGSFFGPPVVHGHGHAHAHAHAAAHGLSGGYFPGKSTVYNQYDVDEYHHNSPYKRQDRKVNFDKPRENIARTTSASVTVPDHFYDYEKQVLMQDRSGKVRSNTNGKLGPSAYEDEGETQQHNFKTTERLGWKVVDMRV